MKDLSQGGLFKSYLQVLSSRQLDKLTQWQGDRLADSPSKDTITDALDKKRMIYLEQKRRR